MKLLLLLGLMFIVGCGNSGIHYGDKRPNTVSDPTFAPYKAIFESTIHRQTGNTAFAIGDIPISFSNDLGNNVLGECWQYSRGGNLIKINSYAWGSASELRKIILINHELGHCRLNRKHTDELFMNVPLSIMGTYILPDVYYQKFSQQYDAELASKSNVNFIAYLKKVFNL